MQTLGVCSWKGENFGCALSDAFCAKRSRKRRLLGNLVGYGRVSGLWIDLNGSSSDGSGVCSGNSRFLGATLFCGYTSTAVFRKPKKCSFGTSFALAWALEQQEIRSEFSDGNSNTINSELRETEIAKSDGFCMDGGNATGDNIDEEEKVVDGQNDGGVGEEDCSRVDVRSLAWSLRLAKTADDVEEVLKDKGVLPLQVFSTMIRGFGKDKRIDPALAVMEWLKRKKEETNGVIYPNLFIYNSLLGAIKQSEQFGELHRVMDYMSHDGVVPNVVTYNTLMAIYLEQGQTIEALNVLEEIRRVGLVPSAVSYSTALLAYRRMEDGIGALRFFTELKEKYLKGEVGKDDNEDWEKEFVKLENFTVRVCYQVMRRWLVKRENSSQKVMKLLSDMDRAGLQHGRAELERLLWACTREDHYVVAKELYTRIRERHSEISLSVCNHLIWLMGKAKRWWAALEIYEDLLDKGPKPNNLSYELIMSHFNILLTAARRKGIWKWGVRLINKMEDKGLKPGSREWNAVLVACSKASEASTAIQIFKRMIEKGEKPTIISYGALLSALEKGKLYEEALKVWDHMIKVGVEPNLYAYTIMASILTGQGKFKMVDAVIKEMSSLGIDPTVVTYNAIISGCARNGMGSAAYEWFHRMKVQNVPPNEVTYEMLIEALARDGKPRLAYELYLRAHNEGLNLSTKAYDAVVRSSQDYGATIDMGVLGPRPPKKPKLQVSEKSI